MAKFLTEIKLNEFVSSRFEAENAGEVLQIMRQFAGEETAVDSEALSAAPPVMFLTLCVVAWEFLAWIDRWLFKRQIRNHKVLTFRRRDGGNY